MKIIHLWSKRLWSINSSNGFLNLIPPPFSSIHMHWSTECVHRSWCVSQQLARTSRCHKCTWKCGLPTHLEICLNSGSWIFLNCVGSMTSRISSISPRNMTWWSAQRWKEAEWGAAQWRWELTGRIPLSGCRFLAKTSEARGSPAHMTGNPF